MIHSVQPRVASGRVDGRFGRGGRGARRRRCGAAYTSAEYGNFHGRGFARRQGALRLSAFVSTGGLISLKNTKPPTVLWAVFRAQFFIVIIWGTSCCKALRAASDYPTLNYAHGTIDA